MGKSQQCRVEGKAAGTTHRPTPAAAGQGNVNEQPPGASLEKWPFLEGKTEICFS
jgi:hypothetical protein